MDISERVNQLEKKVAELERELHQLRLSNQNGRSEIQPPDAQSVPKEASVGKTASSFSGLPPDADSLRTERSEGSMVSPAPKFDRRPARERLAAEEKIDWEHLLARVWLPRIFIVVLLIGVLWGFTAAVNAGFITEPLRCLIGAAAAIVLYVLGERQMRRHREALGQVLLGGASAVMLLSLFAAHMLYGLLPAWIAFAAYVATVTAGLWLGVRYRSQTLVVIMITAGYLLPFLVDTEHPNMWSLAVYEALFSAAMLVLSHRLHYRAASIFAFVVIHLSLLIGSLFAGIQESRVPVLAAILFQHIVLFLLEVTKPKEPKAAGGYVSLLFAFAIAAAWSYGLYGDFDPSVYRGILAAALVIYVSAAYRQFRTSRPNAVCSSVATFALFLLFVDWLDAADTAAPTLIEGLLAVMLGVKLRSALQQAAGGITYAIGVIFVLAHPIHDIVSVETVGWLALFGTIILLYTFLRRSRGENVSKLHLYANSMLWAGAVLFLIFITQVTNALTVTLSANMQHLLLSAVWVAYAIAVIVTGIHFSRKNIRLAGLLALFIALLKIIFIDLPDVSAVVRALLFIGVGAVGVAVSRLFYKRKP